MAATGTPRKAVDTAQTRMQQKQKRRLLWTVIIVGIAALLGIAAFFSIQAYVKNFAKPFIINDVQDAPEAGAIMVLGAFVDSGGRPSLVLRDRLDYGYELYAQGRAAKIIVSGDHGQKEYNEVAAMRDYLIEKGVPREDIFMDHAGFNTYDSMYRAKEIFGVESLLIATQEFHISRSVYIARKLGIDAYGYPSPDRSIFRMRTFKLRESLARVKAVWDVLVERQPRFLGDAIPISGDGSATDG
jgi:vancomycin permeability regulator SanA